MPTDGNRSLSVLLLKLTYSLIRVFSCSHHFACDVAVDLFMDQYTLFGKPT